MKDHHLPLIAVAAAIALLGFIASTREAVDQLPLCQVANAAQCSCNAPPTPLPWRKP